MTENKYDLRKDLRKWLAKSRKTIVAGIGNPIRMDDFVGLKIVRDLREKILDNVILIECETIPESYIQEIVDLNPSHLLLVDAAILGLKPGEARLIDHKQITDFPAITTHVLPLRVFCEYITNNTKATIALLLIQPGNVEFGEGLTPEVDAAAAEITSLLVDYLGSEKYPLHSTLARKKRRVESKGGMGDKT